MDRDSKPLRSAGTSDPGPEALDASEIGIIWKTALGRASGYWVGLSQQPRLDVQDIASEALAKVMESAARETILDLEAYTAAVTKNIVLTRLRSERRSARRESASLEAGVAVDPFAEDDQIAQLISASASADLVVEAIRYGLSLGDQTGIRVVTVWLNMADELSEDPKAVDVARRAGVSPPTVSAALDRFKAYLRAVDPQ